MAIGMDTGLPSQRQINYHSCIHMDDVLANFLGRDGNVSRIAYNYDH